MASWRDQESDSSASSGGMTEGGAVVGGNANYILRNDASGNLDSWIGGQTDASGRICFGGSAGAVPNGARGEVVPAQVRVSSAGNQVAFFAENTSTTGAGGGYIAASNSGPDLFVLSYSGGAGGNYMGAGRPLAGVATIRCAGQLQVFTHAGDLVIGAANVEHVECDGSGGTGVALNRALTLVTTLLSDAAVATTQTLGVPCYQFSGLTANRTFNLIDLGTAGLPVGYTVEFALSDDPGAFAVTLDGNGAQTIDGSATYAMNTDRHTVSLRKSTSTDWRTVVKNA